VLTRLQCFGDERGLSATAMELLDPAVVEAFCVRGLPARRSSTKGTYRSVLHRLARENGHVVSGRGVGFPGAPAPAPYSLSERAELYSMACSQPGEHRGPAARVVLAACIGAGLRPNELVALVASDVVSEGGDVVLSVRGPTARRVVVRPPYGKRLFAIAAEAENGVLFRPGLSKRSYKNAANDLCSHLRGAPGAVQLSVKRCRSSFICDHLAARTPLEELMSVAGICEVESLLRYCVHVPGAPGSKAGLRGALCNEALSKEAR